ncbi:hypothetical protein L2D14_18405 [Thalassospiraceae bacterium LMO-JJ14]|nr:hypothetical protein L2D14_18405 [Thalassospiraceae bacterium LMO-JJ14]
MDDGTKIAGGRGDATLTGGAGDDRVSQPNPDNRGLSPIQGDTPLRDSHQAVIDELREALDSNKRMAADQERALRDGIENAFGYDEDLRANAHALIGAARSPVPNADDLIEQSRASGPKNRKDLLHDMEQLLKDPHRLKAHRDLEKYYKETTQEDRDSRAKAREPYRESIESGINDFVEAASKLDTALGELKTFGPAAEKGDVNAQALVARAHASAAQFAKTVRN